MGHSRDNSKPARALQHGASFAGRLCATSCIERGNGAGKGCGSSSVVCALHPRHQLTCGTEVKTRAESTNIRGTADWAIILVVELPVACEDCGIEPD